MLGVSSPHYYIYRNRPLAPTKMHRGWLTALIKDVHAEKRGTCGSRRVHAELTNGRDVIVTQRLDTVLIQKAGIVGPSGHAKMNQIKSMNRPGNLGGSIPWM